MSAAEFNESEHPRVANGTFTTKELRDADVEFDPYDVPVNMQDLIDAIDAGKPSFQLVTVHPDNGLDDEQITAYLTGDLSTLMDGIDDAYSDERRGKAYTVAREQCEANDVNWDDLDDDEQDEVLDRVYEYDESDIAGQLLLNTGDQLMRANIFHVSDLVEKNPRLFIDKDDHTTTARIDALASEVSKHGVNPDEPGVRAALEELVVHGPAMWHEAVDMDVIWSGDIVKAGIGSFAGRPVDANARVLDFEKPMLALMDRANGGSWVAELPQTARVRAIVSEKSPAFLDSDESKGWGWTKSTGGVTKSAFRNSPDDTWVTRD